MIVLFGVTNAAAGCGSGEEAAVTSPSNVESTFESHGLLLLDTGLYDEGEEPKRLFSYVGGKSAAPRSFYVAVFGSAEAAQESAAAQISPLDPPSEIERRQNVVVLMNQDVAPSLRDSVILALEESANLPGDD